MIREGALSGGLPYLATGAGPPLVVLAGLSPEHRAPTGLDRRMQLGNARALAERFTVYLVGRRPGLAPGTTMRDLAADAAEAIRRELGGPVALMGISTGGSIAQQLAMDHPGVAHRLVLASSACRLSPRGREAQRRLAELTEAGRPREAWAGLGTVLAGDGPAGRLMTGLLWLTGPLSDPDDPSDMIATIRAEDAFDACGGLPRIAIPTLVVAGARDGFYSPDLFRETARRIPGARLLLYPRKGHAGVLAHRPAQRRIVSFLSGEEPPPDLPSG